MPRLPPCRPALDHRCWALWPTRWRTCHTSWRWQPASLHDSAAIPVYNVKWNEEMPSFLFQRSKFDKFYIEHWNFGQILEHFPFSSDVVDGADDDHMLELVIVKIRGSERHDQISQSDQRRVGISKETNDYVTIQHRHGSLITILKRQSDGISRGGEEKELSNFFFYFLFPPYILYQYAIFQGAGGRPVEHASRVVLHLRLFKIEIAGLIVRDPGLDPATVMWSVTSRSTTGWPTPTNMTPLLLFAR